MTTYQDDRTEAQKATHGIGIAMTDSFMSGWGGASGGTSVAVWACRSEDEHRVERWVRSRKEAKRVRTVLLKGYRPRCAHCHVYVVDEGHPALR